MADFNPSEPPESLMHFLVFSHGSFVVFSSPAQLRAKYPSFLVDTLESYEIGCAKLILPLLCWLFLLIGQFPEGFTGLMIMSQLFPSALIVSCTDKEPTECCSTYN